jgi:transposase InsO family protein
LVEEGENAFPGHGRLAPEQERDRQLEREVEILRHERNIQKEAVAIFSHPNRRDSSSSKIESFYNWRRRHSALGYLSPQDYGQLLR